MRKLAKLKQKEETGRQIDKKREMLRKVKKKQKKKKKKKKKKNNKKQIPKPKFLAGKSYISAPLSQ